MEWITLAATALGAVVGVGSTMLAERARWRRDSAERSRQERKEIYVACLTAFRQAHEAMRAIATGDQAREAAALDAAVREAFRAAGCSEARDSAAILVAPEILTAIDDAFYSLRHLRDTLASGSLTADTPYHEVQMEHRRALVRAQAVMRADLERQP